MARATKRSVQVSLTGALYGELRAEAARLGRTATDLAREAIEHHLRERRRREIDRAVSEYARRYAGSAVDLDPLD